MAVRDAAGGIRLRSPQMLLAILAVASISTDSSHRGVVRIRAERR